jgi:lysylphosphatidylglycerol synthetase-like protein (DUF2156 family)
MPGKEILMLYLLSLTVVAQLSGYTIVPNNEPPETPKHIPRLIYRVMYFLTVLFLLSIAVNLLHKL